MFMFIIIGIVMIACVYACAWWADKAMGNELYVCARNEAQHTLHEVRMSDAHAELYATLAAMLVYEEYGVHV